MNLRIEVDIIIGSGLGGVSVDVAGDTSTGSGWRREVVNVAFIVENYQEKKRLCIYHYLFIIISFSFTMMSPACVLKYGAGGLSSE